MSTYRVPAERDTARPRSAEPVAVTVDGSVRYVLPGQTIAAALLEAGRSSWRDTRFGGRPRGVFCGIGVCFDCVVVVNGVPDVRACLRAVLPGDEIRTQHGAELPSPQRGGVG